MPLPPAQARDAAIRHFASARAEGGFTGGDGTYSIPLPGARSAWVFGDSFVGGVQPDGSRSNDPSTFVRNSLVLQDGEQLRMVTGREDGVPVSVARPPGTAENRAGLLPDEWYWPGHGSAAGDGLQVFMHRFRSPPDRDPADTWDWQYRGTDVATFDAATGALRTTTPVTPPGDVIWGTAVLDRGDHSYVYGTAGSDALVARAPRGKLDAADQWTFWDGSAWQRDAALAVRLDGPRVSNQFSVVDARDGGVLLVAQEGFDRTIRAWHADQPQGPFDAGRAVAEIPLQPADRHVYNAVAHPQFTDPDGPGDLLVSFNVGGADFMADHRSYRPGFLTVPGTALPGDGASPPTPG
ncbi:MAG: hypothetical protein JWM86_2717 [Thermoleophilia bacterium]|nr:hypothetical protein [Thermoleophilia bacterium]